jgi:propanediol utilization protein
MEARELGLSHLDVVDVFVESLRPKTFHNVVVRAREGVDVHAFHIDTDEANALALPKEGAHAQILTHG